MSTSQVVRETVTDGDALRRLSEAVEFAFYAVENAVTGGDGEYHSFETSFDGDGWNEPFSVHAACMCRTWVRDWVQTDPEQSGRPSVADLLIAWVDHYESLNTDDDNTGTVVGFGNTSEEQVDG